jgi:hypothetical protein
LALITTLSDAAWRFRAALGLGVQERSREMPMTRCLKRAVLRPESIMRAEDYSGLVVRIPTEIGGPTIVSECDAPSGDWVGAATVDGTQVRIVQADLEGKGHGARPYHDYLSTRLQDSLDTCPADWIVEVDRDWRGERLATMAVVDLDPAHHRIRIALAGHPTPIVRMSGGAAAPLRAYGHLGLVGLKLNADATEVPWLRFTPGSMLVLATDGVLDAGISRGEQFGKDRLRSAIESADEPGQLIEVVVGEVRRHLEGQPLEDDLSLLVIGRRRGFERPASAQGLRTTRVGRNGLGCLK